MTLILKSAQARCEFLNLRFACIFSDVHKINSSASKFQHDLSNSMVNEEFDPRNYRPLEVVLDINIGDLTVHLIKNCLPKDPPCPFVVVEKLAFEMDKTYRETRLQLQLSPVVLRSSGSDKSENWSEQGNFKAVIRYVTKT